MAIEVKVAASTGASFAASLVLALANAVVADSQIIEGLHPVLQFIILAVLPPVITFLSGYATPSRTSKVSSNYGKID